MLGNVKRAIHGTYHACSSRYAGRYLAEFGYNSELGITATALAGAIRWSISCRVSRTSACAPLDYPIGS